MSRYIDADALCKYFESLFEHAQANGLYNHAKIHERAVRLIKEAPPADVVEVVRCKDCKHSFRYECKNDACYKFTMCRRREHYSEGVDENDYCSYGERRTDDE